MGAPRVGDGMMVATHPHELVSIGRDHKNTHDICVRASSGVVQRGRAYTCVSTSLLWLMRYSTQSAASRCRSPKCWVDSRFLRHSFRCGRGCSAGSNVSSSGSIGHVTSGGIYSRLAAAMLSLPGMMFGFRQSRNHLPVLGLSVLQTTLRWKLILDQLACIRR